MTSNPISREQLIKDDWYTGTCDCFSDIPICVLSFLFPSIQFFSNVYESEVDNACVCTTFYFFLNIIELVVYYGSGGSLSICSFIPRAIIRNKIREKYGIEGSCESDFIFSICCACCSLAQEAREINAREPK
jgi:Cys-rich protein (TIGR01571 family)